MKNNTTLNVSELDFDSIKSNFKDFLKNQSKFTDYDFEGSAMSVLLDILAYNTHYQSYYLNSIANEMFLDSATMRSSIVSKAKHLNYLPDSKKCSNAIVDIEVNPHDDPVSVILDKGTKFESNVNGNKYIFVPKQTYTIHRVYDDNVGKYIYKKEGIELLQGIRTRFKWVNNKKDFTQKFIIPNNNIDINTLSVRIQNSEQDLYSEEFFLAKDTTKLTDVDNVYYLQEVENNKYEIYFGDGVLGKELSQGNVIFAEYLTTQSEDANGCVEFKSLNPINGYTNYKITTKMKSVGGAPEEDMESIRFNAPKTFEGQNRAVTIRDYKTIVPKVFPQTKTLSVWGGEDNYPPKYGKVMISIRPLDGYFMSNAVKDKIKSDLIKDWSIVSITPEIVDPEYTFIIFDIIVKYNEQLTIYSADEIYDIVERTVNNYNNNYLNDFDSYFRYSHFTTLIDNSDNSITNNLSKVKLKQFVSPILNADTTIIIKFNNKIEIGSLKTTEFSVGGKLVDSSQVIKKYFMDNEDGTISIRFIHNGIEYIHLKNVGTIDYENGIIEIKTMTYNWLTENNNIEIVIEPIHNDVIQKRNQLLLIDELNSSIIIENDTI